MKSLKIEDGKIKIRSRGILMALFGLPLLLVGCGLTVASFFGGGQIEILPLIAGIFVTLLLAGAGLLVSIPARLEIDAHARTYRQRFGFLTLTKAASGSLDEFDRVTLDREVRTRRSDHGRRTYTVYPIRLVGPASRLDVVSRRKLAGARNQAEQVAKTLGLPLADRSGSEEIVREAAYLDESLRQRRRRTGEAPSEIPEMPQGAKTQFRREGEEMVLEIPSAGFTPDALAYLLPAVVVPAVAYFFFLRPMLREINAGPSRNVVIGLICFFFVLLPVSTGVWAFLRAIRTRYTVRVSPERLHVTRRGVLFWRTSKIPADEIEELQITRVEEQEGSWRKAEIVARSDRTTAKFGVHLSMEEKQWIRTVLEHVLTT